jgi:UDP:flavonoid glycosyltransferase YjiC (YdhE family)
MHKLVVLLVCVLATIQCKNVLVVAPGLGGHIRPNFDLAKKLASRGHDITLLTEALALKYINTTSIRLKELILTDTSPDALQKEIEIDEKLNAEVAQTKNLMNGIIHFFSYRSNMEIAFYKKISQLFEEQKFDLMIVDFSAFTVRPLILKHNTPCVIAWGTYIASTDVPDVNIVALSNPLTRKTFNTLFGRLHNFLRSIAFTFRVAGYVLGLFNKIYNDENIPEEYRHLATINNFNAATDKCMSLISTPRALNAERFHNYQHRFLGTFMDLEEALKPQELGAEIGDWINRNSDQNIVFGALGTTTYLSEERMTNFVQGLEKFLLKESNHARVLLALSKTNYALYLKVVKSTKLENSDGILVVDTFVPQRAILQHPSVKVFISHGGTGSVVESCLYAKPTLVMPYHFDHHYTAIKIQELNAGLSLFTWEPQWKDLFIDNDHVEYSFTSQEVATKLEKLLFDETYAKGVENIRREIMYGGGAERAAEEMEYFMDAKGFEYQRPLHLDYPIYRRLYLDFIAIGVLIAYISYRVLRGVLSLCIGSKTKQKKE